MSISKNIYINRVHVNLVSQLPSIEENEVLIVTNLESDEKGLLKRKKVKTSDFGSDTKRYSSYTHT